ncbi:unnamed protein product [Rotaria socialis]|uniref:Tetratricopeptide repeat protein n=1 Tax=Rotaria socialis TaxID=392032 RepID=A0A821QTY5_9BILA|nr:unnamed protein product [Rotaria socialis]CAF4826989.1 unnamed protein product [Rotaria socialis]
MKVTDEGTHEIQEKIDAENREFRTSNINLMFGRLLLEMNEYTKAQSYFHMMLQVLPKSHEDLALVYDHIGDLKMRTTNCGAAFVNVNLAYAIKKKIMISKHPCIGVTLNNIGNSYRPIGNYTQALEYYTKVLHCRNDQSNMARIRLNIGAIYSMSNDCEKGLKLCIEVRDIIQQVQLCPYNEIIRYQGIIGDIHLIQKDYDTAEHYYVAAFETSKRFLFTDHRLRLHCIKSLTDLYVKRNMKEYAIQFCLDQLSVYEIYLPEIRVNIANLSMKISELFEDSSDQKQDLLLKALRILETSVHLEYVATINCLMMITEYYQKQNFDERASNYYIRALEIRKKSTQKMISSLCRY